MKHALTISFIAFAVSLTGCVTEGNKGITNATASAVLDQGSYVVVLSIAGEKAPLQLLVMHPTRRLHPNDCIGILGEDGKVKEIIHPEELPGKRLHRQLLTAISHAAISTEIKTICVMLDRVLTDPTLPWSKVYFGEKWE